MEELYNSELATLSYNNSTKTAELVWKKEAGSDEYRNIFKVLIDFSEKNRIRSFLSDMKSQGVVRLEDVQWLDKEVLARAISHRLEKIALVTKDTIFSSVYADAIKKKLEKSSIALQIFEEASEARAWLAG
jgi:hypothetical protein